MTLQHDKKKELTEVNSFLVTPTGFKPVTFASVVRCSIQLSYGAVVSLLRVQRYNIFPNYQNILQLFSQLFHNCLNIKNKKLQKSLFFLFKQLFSTAKPHFLTLKITSQKLFFSSFIIFRCFFN